ncbi:Coq4 family protein [Novosphingobium bradum]|uniref:Coq4 family protein n=1 Tax=Novosphingobium bradum TaxID=1737444 RepID=A0ABV7IQ17_9SPHN
MNDMTGHKQPRPRLVRAMSEAEAAYLQGGEHPPTGSFLTSNSKFLNSPVFRDAWCQASLRRYGWDLPVTYHLPTSFRAVAEVTDVDRFVALVEAEKRTNPGFRDWVDARKLPVWPLDRVRECAPGTLGAAIHEFMAKSGMSADFMRQGDPIESDVDYILKRRSAGHDVEHIVTGFGTNQPGEHAISLLSSVGSNLHLTPELAGIVNLGTAMANSASFMRNSIHYPAGMPYLLKATQKAIEMGFALPCPMYMVDWDQYLDMTIADTCADLGITYNTEAEEWYAVDHLFRG